MNRLIARLSAWSQGFSIRVKIMGLAVGMVLLMGLSAAALAQSGFARATAGELELRGISIANDVSARAADLVLTSSALGLHELVKGTRLHNPDVRYVMMLDSQGRVIAQTFGDRFPIDLLNLPIPSGQESVIRTVLSTEEGLVHDVAVPILNGLAGTVRVGMSPVRLRAEALHLSEWMTATVLVMATMALICAYLLTTILTRPVLALVDAAQVVGSGDLTRRAPKGPPDEIGQLINSFNDMVARLEESKHVQRELLNRVLSAQEDERRRLARELHDETSQAITSIIVGLRTLEEAHPEIRERTGELRKQASATLEEIHNLIMELRPRVLDELGLVPALRRHVSDFGRKHSLSIDFQTVGKEVRLPAPVENCLYRVVQEALTNVVRHAGASGASVVISIVPPLVTAIVEDDGHGFDPNSDIGVHSLGLAGMRERVFLVDGTLEIESSAAGTSVFVKIPLKEGQSRAHSNRVGG